MHYLYQSTMRIRQGRSEVVTWQYSCSIVVVLLPYREGMLWFCCGK
jgi:hypothetical protein